MPISPKTFYSRTANTLLGPEKSLGIQIQKNGDNWKNTFARIDAKVTCIKSFSNNIALKNGYNEHVKHSHGSSNLCKCNLGILDLVMSFSFSPE